MFFLWIRRNQNSPRIWPNLDQLKPCQEFHNFPNLLFQESCLLTNRPRKLVSTNFLPSSISSPLSHLLSGTCNLTIPLSLSLSLSPFGPPLPLFSSQLSLFTGALHEFLIDQRHEEAKHSELFELLYPGNRLQKCKEFITLFRHILGINKSDRFLNPIVVKKRNFPFACNFFFLLVVVESEYLVWKDLLTFFFCLRDKQVVAWSVKRSVDPRNSNPNYIRGISFYGLCKFCKTPKSFYKVFV